MNKEEMKPIIAQTLRATYKKDWVGVETLMPTPEIRNLNLENYPQSK